MNENIYFQFLEPRFDEQLGKMALKWLPWVGDKYLGQNNKLLIVGESCYDWNKPGSGERLARTSFTREMVEIDDAINHKSKVKFYRNLERAVFKKKRPSPEHCKELWRSVCFHNLVLREMPTKKHRPTANDYLEGWRALLVMTQVLQPDHCLFAGTDWQKIDALFGAARGLNFPVKRELLPVKVGRSKGRMYNVDVSDGYSVKIVFMRHPSSFFQWKDWGDFLRRHVPAISAIHESVKN